MGIRGQDIPQQTHMHRGWIRGEPRRWSLGGLREEEKFRMRGRGQEKDRQCSEKQRDIIGDNKRERERTYFGCFWYLRQGLTT